MKWLYFPVSRNKHIFNYRNKFFMIFSQELDFNYNVKSQTVTVDERMNKPTHKIKAKSVMFYFENLIPCDN